MSISFEGIGYQCVTFPAGDCSVGAPCDLNSSGKVVDCDENDKVMGVVEQIRGGWAGVQTHGYVTLPYTGTTVPSPGFVSLSCDGSGGVKVDATNGRIHTVVAVDTTAGTVTFEL